MNNLLLIPILLICILTSSLSQKNDISVDLTPTEFHFNESKSINHNSTQLHPINEQFSDRLVLRILAAADGSYYVIQENTIHHVVDNNVIKSFYFYQSSEEIETAYFQDEELLVIVGEDQTVGYINTNDKLQANIEIINRDKQNSNLIVNENRLYEIRDQSGQAKSISELSIIDHKIKSDQLYSFLHPYKITSLNISENGMILLDDKDHLYKINHRKLVLIYQSELRENLILNKSNIIRYKNGYFIFFKYSKGLYWIEDGKSIVRCSHDGVYQYHAFDAHGRLLLGLGIRPRLVNTLLLIDNFEVSYFDHVIDWNAIKHVYSSDFTKSQFVSGNNGLYQIKYNFERPGISRYLYDSNKKLGEFGKVILDIESIDGEIYAVSESNQGVYRLENDEFKLIYEDNKLFNKISKDTINQALWINSYDQERKSSIYKIKNRKIEKIIDTDILILGMAALSRDSILLCGLKRENRDFTGLIYLFNPLTNEMTNIYETIDKDIWVVQKIGNHVLMGLRKGLLKYNIKTGDISELKGIQGQYISSIREIDGEVIVCTKSNGMYRFSADLNIIDTTYFNEYPVSNRITDIIPDHFGNYWVSTFKDIALLDKNKELLMTINEEDGISAYEFNSGASIMTSDHQLFFGSINGITKIDINKFYEENGNIVDIKRLQGIKENNYSTPDYNDKSYTFNFIPEQIELELKTVNSTSDTERPGYAEIRVILDGKSIHIDQIKDKVKINSIEAGRYVFLQNKLNGEPHEIATMIVKRNYTSIIQQLLLAFAVALISFLLTKWIYQRENRIVREKAEMNNRLVELKLESLRSQLNPHFVFNCLNSIQYYIQVNEKKLAREYLTKFSKLMRLFLESSRNEKITITDEIELLTLYLELEQLRFEDKFSFNIQSEIDGLTKVPPMIVQPFVENSIVHGFSELEDRSGKILISFKDDSEGVNCEITDNGIGRKAAGLRNLQHRKKHKSRATKIIKERIEITQQQADTEQLIKYEDVTDKDGQVLGTKVSLKLV